MTEYGEGYVLKNSLLDSIEWDRDIEKWVIWDDDIKSLMTEENDVAPVVHGEWIGIWGDGYANGFIVYEEFECSRCGCVHHTDGEPMWDYCPQCGARMDGGESNDQTKKSR